MQGSGCTPGDSTSTLPVSWACAEQDTTLPMRRTSAMCDYTLPVRRASTQRDSRGLYQCWLWRPAGAG